MGQNITLIITGNLFGNLAAICSLVSCYVGHSERTFLESGAFNEILRSKPE